MSLLDNDQRDHFQHKLSQTMPAALAVFTLEYADACAPSELCFDDDNTFGHGMAIGYVTSIVYNEDVIPEIMRIAEEAER